MKFIFSFSLILFLGSTSFSQNKNFLKLYQFGAWYDPGDSCINYCNSRYGFKTVSGGCSPRRKDVTNNQKVQILLLKKNGIGWKEKYKTDLFKCCSTADDSLRISGFLNVVNHN